MNSRFFTALKTTKKNLLQAIPLVTGVLLLVALLNSIFKLSQLGGLFHHHTLTDSLIGATIGSLAAGNPITSYILGGEFMKNGVSLVAVTAFVLAWVTVGLVQLPTESIMLGKKFALV